MFQISHCLATRRIAVGTRNGSMAMYEMRASRVQNIPAHGVSFTFSLVSKTKIFNTTFNLRHPLLPSHLIRTGRTWWHSPRTRTNSHSGRQGKSWAEPPIMQWFPVFQHRNVRPRPSSDSVYEVLQHGPGAPGRAMESSQVSKTSLGVSQDCDPPAAWRDGDQI